MNEGKSFTPGRSLVIFSRNMSAMGFQRLTTRDESNFFYRK
jgi:hypothetical protein